MRPEPTAARITERYVIEKYDGDVPTPDQPKQPVEIVTIERRADGTTQTTVQPSKE